MNLFELWFMSGPDLLAERYRLGFKGGHNSFKLPVPCPKSSVILGKD